MERLIIGLVGPIASGKGFLASHLQELGFFYTSLSDRVRDEARSKNIELTRENLQNIGNNLRETYGSQILAERTALLLSSSDKTIVIDSIRNPAEIEYLRKVLNIKILGITAPEATRLEWYMARAKERNEDGATAVDFQKSNERDLGGGENNSGQQVKKCLEIADYIIENYGSKEQLIEVCNLILDQECHFNFEGN